MPALTPADVAQLYNGIYGPPALGPAPIAPMSVEEMYRGIYPAAPAPAPAPAAAPTAPAYDVYRGIYGPANLASEVGLFPGFGSLLDMFPGTSRTKTETVAPAAPNGVGYQAGRVKDDNERLLPNGGLSTMFGAGPATRRVQSVPVPQQAGVALPRPRPGVGPLASMYAAPAAPSQREPLRIAVSGAGVAGGRAPTPAPASQRPAAQTSVQQLQAQGLSPSQAYDMANQQARERAIANSSNPSANSARASMASRWGFE